jgi:hypothetical protein
MLSYVADIVPLFREKDLGCMDKRHWPLADAVFMCDPAGSDVYADHWHARYTFSRLSSTDPFERMPKGGPSWSQESLLKFQQWMDDGFHP